MTDSTTSNGAIPPYEPEELEAAHQRTWRERAAFRTPEASEGQRVSSYIKPSAPFTSGNIHIGHVRSYTIGDAYARFLRGRGEEVLFAFGFDAFGLPAELGAISNETSPSEWVSRCADHMRGQLERLGFSFDWERTFLSSDAVMYRWSQWLFLTLLEAGLIYRGTGNVDWCDTCATTLATIQVEDGRCWRCHNPVRLVQRPEWFLRLSAYVAENDERLEGFENWDENSLASQRFVLGRVDGVEVDLSSDDGPPLTAFTPYGDAVDAARFVLISPKHPDLEQWAADPEVQRQIEELRSGGLERGSRDAETIPLVHTGHLLTLPGREDPLPLLISPIVDGRFGPTAVLGIPEHDRSDALIEERLGGPRDARTPEVSSLAPDGEGSTRTTPTRPARRYRANDFTISRQRSWGTPIPIVYCERCGTVPVAREDLPVRLPLDLKPTGEGNPLAECEEFVNTSCPSCGGAARRETDTLDCHFDALWLWVPACVPAADRERPLEEILDLPDLRRWLPSERLVAGSDSGNFVFDQRVVTKALRDIGPLAFLSDGEPFAGCLFHEMVIRDGRKMSKHLGNVVDPDELVATYGADTVRLAVLYAARPQKSLNWSDSAVLHCHRFLNGLWKYAQARFAIDPALAHPTSSTGDQPAPSGGTAGEQADPGKTEFLRNRLTKWCEIAVEKVTEDLADLEMHKAVRNMMRLLDRIKDFESRVIARNGVLGPEDHEALVSALALLAQTLAPFAPHIGEELWIASGHGEPGMDVPWPELTSTELLAGERRD